MSLSSGCHCRQRRRRDEARDNEKRRARDATQRTALEDLHADDKRVADRLEAFDESVAALRRDGERVAESLLGDGLVVSAHARRQ